MAFFEKRVLRKPEGVTWFRDLHSDIGQQITSINQQFINSNPTLGISTATLTVIDSNTNVWIRSYANEEAYQTYHSFRLQTPEFTIEYQYNLENNISNTSTVYTA
jgi:hypothetical protein